MNPCLAIVNNNNLSTIALKHLITENFGMIEVYSYSSMEEFIRDSNRHFVHFFVSSDIFFRHIDEFETLSSRTTILSVGPNRRYEAAGYKVLDISQSEKEIVGNLLMTKLVGNYESSGRTIKKDLLSAREREVLEYMVKGMINKEIAEKMQVSINTIIFHRNNICEKLQTRSLGKLTIFAVLSGIVDINEL